MNSSSLPLCSRIIKEKIKQTNYIYSIWNNATIVKPPRFQPKSCGWFLQNDTFKIKWLEGEISSSTVKILCPENENDVSSVITVKVWSWKKKLIFMKTLMTYPMRSWRLTTPLTGQIWGSLVGKRDQIDVADHQIFNVHNLFYSNLVKKKFVGYVGKNASRAHRLKHCFQIIGSFYLIPHTISCSKLAIWHSSLINTKKLLHLVSSLTLYGTGNCLLETNLQIGL